MQEGGADVAAEDTDMADQDQEDEDEGDMEQEPVTGSAPKKWKGSQRKAKVGGVGHMPAWLLS